MIRKDKRMSLLSHREGVNLQITNLHIDDAGNYICEVEHEGEPIIQTNQLQVLGNLSLWRKSPKNLSFSASENCNFAPWEKSYCKKGFKVKMSIIGNLWKQKFCSVKLSCNASGFPLPKISWQRQVGLDFILRVALWDFF